MKKNPGLQIAAAAIPAAIGLAAAGVSSSTPPSDASDSKANCPTLLKECPDIGCEKAGTPNALINKLKRTMASGTTPIILTFDDFHSLQAQADKTVGERKPLDEAARAKGLRNMKVTAGLVSEGDLVEVAGYLIGSPHPNTGESVNCNLPRPENNDFHIPISSDPGNDETDGIVVEMIPQGRNPAWNLKALTTIEGEQRMVRVVGQLLYDNKHKINTDGHGGDPKRYSLFEVHPVSKFLVCKSNTGTCDPGQEGQWESLETWKQQPQAAAPAPTPAPSPTPKQGSTG